MDNTVWDDPPLHRHPRHTATEAAGGCENIYGRALRAGVAGDDRVGDVSFSRTSLS